MATIPKQTIEEIRSRCNVVEVIGSYLPQLRRRGATFKCNCPFHQEKTPSFTVNETRQIYHCFGCGAGGDVFRFVMEYEKVDFVTAVKMLAERAGVEVVFEGGSPEKSGDKDTLYKIHREAAAFYHRLLTAGSEGAEARRYLEERSLPAELIKEFQIGFAPNKWDGLLKRALKKGYTAEQLEDAGLAVPSQRQGTKSYYDRFRNRIMFPICDPMGRVIGFSGRIMNKAEKGAKYVNSPETRLFRKNQVLFALDKARKAIVDARQAIVVEGQIDAMRCHQAGLTHVVASQGTALTENHARLIKRYADEVVLVLDADAAGIKAALASAEIFVAAELSVRVGTLPEKEDPDSLILKHGAEVLSALVSEAPAALDFLIECLGRREDMNTEAGRMRVVKAALNLIRRCPSAARRDAMIQQAADLLHLSPQALGQDLRREQHRQRPPARRAEETAQETPANKTHPKEEIALLELLVHHYADAQPLVHEYLRPEHLSDSVCRELVELLMVELPETLLEELQDFDAETQRVISRIQIGESRTIDSSTSPIEPAQHYIRLFWKRRLERELASITKNKDLTHEERFKESTYIRQDLLKLADGWDSARTVIAARLHDGSDEETI
jgi:DNA primase